MAVKDNRYMKRGTLEVKVRYKTETKTFHGFSENVSTGGLFVVTDNPLPIGECLDVTFTVPKSEVKIDARVIVRWIRNADLNNEDVHPGMGLQFVVKESGSIDDAASREYDIDEETVRLDEMVEESVSKPVDMPASMVAWNSDFAEDGKGKRNKSSRRDIKRFHIRAQVDFETESNFYIGISENISRGGLFISTPDPLPVGENVVLSIYLQKNEKPIKTMGVVKWASDIKSEQNKKRFGMGLKFVDLDKDVENVIKIFVDHVRKPYICED